MNKKKASTAIRYSKEERRGILEDYLQSGFTVKEYCLQTPISHGTLHRWLRESKEKALTKKRQYSPLERKEAVEQFMKSGLTQQAFAKVWGVDLKTINKWYQIYREKGPMGLADGMIYGEGNKRGRRPVKQEIKSKILKVKKNLPRHGLKKLRDFLYRFEGVKVAPNTIKKVLVEGEIYDPPKEAPKKKAPPLPRRFERANPMQLWQSDITSFVLRRNSQRVYLVVFKDDHSRYIVSWALALKQTGQFVIECFLDGVQKFGKPHETLTDQGRQYFSWRGKSEFQRLLEKEGVRHVVSRSHHPQTLGKCERFWKTVGNEFWDRAKPQELSEARERMSHFINHYNHFRPHQGIDGATPADRFFRVGDEVKEVIEKNLSQNELRLSIDQAPRKPFYFVGQIGEKRVTMHGESGKLHVNTPSGEIERIDYEDFGNGSGETIGNIGGEERKYSETEEERKTQREQDAKACDTSERPMGVSEPGRAGEGAYASTSDRRLLDGPQDEDGSSECIGSESSSFMADGPTSDLGDVCRTIETTKEDNDDESERRSEIFEEENSRTGENSCDAGEIDRSLEINAGLQTCDLRGGAPEGEALGVEEKNEEEDQEKNQEDRSESWQEAQTGETAGHQNRDSDTTGTSKQEWWNNFLKKKGE